MILSKDNHYVYAELERDLEQQIRSGQLRPGALVLSENELGKKYGVSRRSSRKALESLEMKGLLRREPGRGTFVASSLPTENRMLPVVSFVVPDIEDPFISELGRGISEAARGRAHLIFQSAGGSVEQENANIEFLIESRAAGAVIFPNWGHFNIEELFKLKQANIPFVLVDRCFESLGADCVVVNNREGARSAVEYLIAAGHRRIGHLFGTEGSANNERFEGYRDALTHAGILYRDDYVRRIEMDSAVGVRYERFEPDKAFGYKNMMALLQLPEPPTAVFAGNDFQAMGALQAAREMNLDVPGSLSIVGFDDLKMVSYLPVPLTTVRQPKCEIGRQAFNLLFRRLSGDGQGFPARIVLDTELVIRKSAAPIAEPATSV